MILLDKPTSATQSESFIPVANERASPDSALVTGGAAQAQGVGGDVVVDVDIAQQLAR